MVTYQHFEPSTRKARSLAAAEGWVGLLCWKVLELKALEVIAIKDPSLHVGLVSNSF